MNTEREIRENRDTIRSLTKCPFCGVLPGIRCRSRSGNGATLPTLHKARTTAFHAQDPNWVIGVIPAEDKVTLYHGTTTEFGDSIASDGLIPRRESGQLSNWEGPDHEGIRSRPDLVYLTSAYPVYFANAAVGVHGGDLLIVECEVDRKALYPDEDFIHYVIQHDPEAPKWAKALKPEDINPRSWSDAAKHSLTANGKVSTPSVPASQIKRTKTIQRDDWKAILQLGGDTTPTPLGFGVLGNTYKKVIAALFDDGVEGAVEVYRKAFSVGHCISIGSPGA